MKLPELKLGRSSGGSGSPPGPGGLKPPKFLADLYADLRDRRLLPLVALLLVAIVAVPFLLGGKSEEEPLAVPPVATAPPSSHADFSVVPAARSLREPRQRLGYREARDPFKTESIEAPSEPSGASETSEGTSSESGTPAAEAPAEEVIVPPVEIPSESSSSSETTHKTTTKTQVVVKNQVIGYGIDGRLGFTGHIKPQTEIAPMTKLPNAKHPVIVYVGPNDDKTGAVFLMTNNVSAFYGGGSCKLGGQVCQLLELKTGKSATFAYGYGEARYKVSLRRVVPLVSSEKVEAEVTKKHGE